MSNVEWLPPLVLMDDYEGRWEDYLEALYDFFSEDFIVTKPHLEGMQVMYRRGSMEKGKAATFWHIISSGKSETEREPDLRRCECIRWPKRMIEAAGTNQVKCWRNKRRNDARAVIALVDFSYVVILSQKKGYYLLLTAYCVESPKRRGQFQKEYEKYQKS